MAANSPIKSNLTCRSRGVPKPTSQRPRLKPQPTSGVPFPGSRSQVSMLRWIGFAPGRLGVVVPEEVFSPSLKTRINEKILTSRLRELGSGYLSYRAMRKHVVVRSTLFSDGGLIAWLGLGLVGCNHHNGPHFSYAGSSPAAGWLGRPGVAFRRP